MSEILEKSSAYVINLYNQKLPQGITYHNLDHTLEVVQAAADISDNSGLNKSEEEKVLLACWFHDTGIIASYQNHEEESARICTEFLSLLKYPESSINEVCSAIMATRIPSKPQTIIEQVVCDADISHTAKAEFDNRSRQLREEWETILGRVYTDEEWLESNINFLSSVKFYTRYAKDSFEPIRIVNLEKLKTRTGK